jgi:membrane protease YdiL (CAAX protease family)
LTYFDNNPLGQAGQTLQYYSIGIESLSPSLSHDRGQNRSASVHCNSCQPEYSEESTEINLKEVIMRTFQLPLAKNHPVFTFLCITFAWTWLFWFSAIPLDGRSLLGQIVVMIGGYGPAIGGILTLGLKNGISPRFSRKKFLVLIGAAVLIFLVFVLRYHAGNIVEGDVLADDLTLSPAILTGAIITSLIGGWVASSAFSHNAEIRARMKSIVPVRLSIGWTIFTLGFYPAMILGSWGLAVLFGWPVEFPARWDQPLVETLPIYLLTFMLTLLAQGGNEEPGWRGFLQPAMQKYTNPLIAAIIISLFWSVWHLPLFLNGFYSGDIVTGMAGGAIYRVLLAIFMAWFHNRNGGNVFLMIVLHTTFNKMVGYLPVSDMGLLGLWVIIVTVVVIKDRMWRKLPANDRSSD